jgi:hypothetical protein
MEKINIDNYGDLLAVGLEMRLLAYEEYGSYQGDYIAILFDDKEKKVKVYKGCYGSCSGCDWLEAERDWRNNSLSKEQINSYCKNEKPFAELDKRKLETIVNSEDPKIYFPANTRNNYNDWSWGDLRNILEKAQSEM